MQTLSVYDAQTDATLVMVRTTTASLMAAVEMAQQEGLRTFEVRRLPHGTEIWVGDRQIIGTRPYVKATTKKVWTPTGRPPRDGWYSFSQILTVPKPEKLPAKVSSPFFMVFLDEGDKLFDTVVPAHPIVAAEIHKAQVSMMVNKKYQGGTPIIEDWRDVVLSDPKYAAVKAQAHSAVIGFFDQTTGAFMASSRKLL